MHDAVVITLQFQQWRAMDVFLIDAQPSMHQECGMEADVRFLLCVLRTTIGVCGLCWKSIMFQAFICLPYISQGIEPTDTWFGIALKVVRATLKQKIISSPNDQSAVVLYGTVGDSRVYKQKIHAHIYPHGC